MSNPGKEVGDGGATAEPVNLLLLLSDLQMHISEGDEQM